MIAAAAVAGALVAAGLALLAAELTRRAPALGTPPARWRSAAASPGRIALAAAAGLAALAITHWPVAALTAAGAVGFVPRTTASRAARRRTCALEGLEQWTRRISDLLTASRGLEDAIAVSARTAPVAIAAPVIELARRLSAGVGNEDALRTFAAEIHDPAGDRIAAALIIATGRRGGAVAGVLSALAEMLARDVAARREIEAERAQHRATVRWIVVFVGGFTAFAVLNRAYSAPFGTLAGQVVMAVVALLYTAGLGWLHRLGSIPGPGRFLHQRPEKVSDLRAGAGPRVPNASAGGARR